MAPEETPDFVELLEEELSTCVMPSVTDPGDATVEDLVRDLHKMMVGNGNPTKGIVFKVAAANANLKVLRRNVKTVEGGLDSQVDTCAEFRAKMAKAAAVADAEQTTIRKIGKALWKEKGLILLLILSTVFYINNKLPRSNKVDKAVEQRIQKLLDAKLSQLVMEKSTD